MSAANRERWRSIADRKLELRYQLVRLCARGWSVCSDGRGEYLYVFNPLGQLCLPPRTVPEMFFGFAPICGDRSFWTDVYEARDRLPEGVS